MFTLDSARQAAYHTALGSRNEELRERMFGAAGMRALSTLPRMGTRDADALAEFTANMTEYIDNVLEMEDFPGTSFRKVMTMKTDIPEGSDVYTRREFTATGAADWLDENANTAPMLTTGVAPTSRNLLPLGKAYRITRSEILRATEARMPISTEKARVARELVEEKLDRVMYLGDTSLGIYGLLNHPGIPINDATTGTWSTATAAQIEADILTMVNNRADATLSTDWQYYLGLPIAQYNKLAQTRMGTYNDMTIATWLRTQIPQILGFFSTARLKEAAADDDDYGVLVPQGARWGRGLLPADAKTIGPHQTSFLGEDFLVHAKTGGFFTLKPLAFEIIEGI